MHQAQMLCLLFDSYEFETAAEQRVLEHVPKVSLGDLERAE